MFQQGYLLGVRPAEYEVAWIGNAIPVVLLVADPARFDEALGGDRVWFTVKILHGRAAGIVGAARNFSFYPWTERSVRLDLEAARQASFREPWRLSG